MANAEKIAGVNSYILYGAESTYGTAVSTTKHFGLVTSFKPSLKNNLILGRSFKGTSTGGRNVAKVVGGKFESGFSIDFEPQVFDWMEYVLGTAPTGLGTGASPYVYAESDAVGSLTVSHSIDNATTDRDTQYLGALVNTCTIRCSVGEAVTVSLDFVSGDVDKDSTVQSAVALDTSDPFTFAGGSIEIPDGSAISNIIDSAEITITNNAEVLYGLGSRTGQAGVVKARDYNVKFTLKYLDETFIDWVLGSATGPTTPTRSATMSLKFTNGTNKYIDFVFTGVTFEDYSVGADLNEVLTEDMNAICESLSVTEQQQA